MYLILLVLVAFILSITSYCKTQESFFPLETIVDDDLGSVLPFIFWPNAATKEECINELSQHLENGEELCTSWSSLCNDPPSTEWGAFMREYCVKECGNCWHPKKPPLKPDKIAPLSQAPPECKNRTWSCGPTNSNANLCPCQTLPQCHPWKEFNNCGLNSLSN